MGGLRSSIKRSVHYVHPKIVLIPLKIKFYAFVLSRPLFYFIIGILQFLKKLTF